MAKTKAWFEGELRRMLGFDEVMSPENQPPRLSDSQSTHGLGLVRHGGITCCRIALSSFLQGSSILAPAETS